LRAAVAAAKTADPMAAVTIVAPDNIAGITVRRALAEGIGGRPGVAAVDVTTLPKLAERLAAPTLAPRRPATSLVVAAAWRRELAADPQGFASVAAHPATVRALTLAHHALRDLSPAALDAVAASTTVAGDVVALHRRVVARLAPAWYDRTDLLRAAAEKAGSLPPVILYLPQDLDRAETAFAQAIPDLTVIAGRTGVIRADRGPARLFASLDASVPPESRAISTGTRVLTASDSDDEVRAVVRDLMVTLRSVPAHRVAVLYAAASPYARVIAEQLAAAGITVNGAGVRPVEERAVPRLLTGLLALGESDVPRADLFQALAAAPAHDFTGTRIPLATWERLSRTAGVVKGDDWEERLGAHARRLREEAEREESAEEPRLWLVERCRRDAATAEALRAFAIELRERLRRATSLVRWSELAEWTAALLTATSADGQSVAALPPDEQYAAISVQSIIADLAALDDIEPTATLAGLRDALGVALTAALPRVGRFSEGVLAAPISAAVGLDLDVVYVVGLSEDPYPGRIPADGLLPDAARAAAAGELPARRDELDRKHRHLLTALACASTSVVSFPRGDLRRSTARLPSRFILPTLRALAADTRLAATEWDRPDYRGAVVNAPSFAGALLNASTPATEQEWRIRAELADAASDDGIVAAAVAMIHARHSAAFTRFDGNLDGAAGLPDFASGVLPVSPTALESYADCPHTFFVGRLLGVEPLEQPEDVVTISPLDIGNLIHRSVEEFITEFADALPRDGAPWAPSQRARLAEIALAQAEEFQRRGLTGHRRLWEGERARILADVNAMIDDEDAWRAERGVTVVASEMPFGLKGAEPERVPVPSGTVAMRGSADRVDRDADGTLWVTDIKTGKSDGFKTISETDPTVGGTKLQLPVYAHAARSRFGADEVRAQYWFVRRDAGTRVQLPLTPAVEEAYARALDVLVRSITAGLFPLKAPEAADFAWVQCPYCNPDGLGHAENRDRWERKRSDPALRELITLIDPDGVPAEEDVQ
jgi:RecB family exonuclease